VSDRLHQTASIPHDHVSPQRIATKVMDVIQELEEGAERRRLALDWNTFSLSVQQERTNGLHLPTDEPLGHYLDAQVDVLS
jgi:hypothetical protein